MSVSIRKNRALKRILRNKFHAPAHDEPAARREPAAATAGGDEPAYKLSADIPKNYNDTYVRAIPRDPQNTFVYWEVPQERAASAGIPDRGNIHTLNDKASWIQDKISAPPPELPPPPPLPIPETIKSPFESPQQADHAGQSSVLTEHSPVSTEQSPVSTEHSPKSTERSPVSTELSSTHAGQSPILTEHFQTLTEEQPPVHARQQQPPAHTPLPIPETIKSPFESPQQTDRAEQSPVSTEHSPVSTEQSPVSTEHSPVSTERSPVSTELSSTHSGQSPVLTEHFQTLTEEQSPVHARQQQPPAHTPLPIPETIPSPFESPQQTDHAEQSPVSTEQSPVSTEHSPEQSSAHTGQPSARHEPEPDIPQHLEIFIQQGMSIVPNIRMRPGMSLLLTTNVPVTLDVLIRQLTQLDPAMSSGIFHSAGEGEKR